MTGSTAERAPAPRGALSPRMSAQIKIARVICILAVVFVHSPPYGDTMPATPWSLDGYIWLVREMLGRTSIPLLSIISGYLVITLRPAPYRSMLEKKLKTLIVPLVLWNLLALGSDALRSGGAEMPSLMALPRLLFALYDTPRLFPLYFLRDIFICFTLLPLLRAGVRFQPWLVIGALAINMVFNLDGILFLNSAIPLFFVIGLALADGRISAAPLRAHPRLFAGLALAILVGLALRPFIPALAGVDRLHWVANIEMLVQRGAGAVLFWVLTGVLLDLPRLAKAILRIEPKIFFVFCGHPLLLGFAWMPFGKLGLASNPAVLAAFFTLSPLIALALGLIGIQLLGVVAPWLLKWLMAGKDPRRSRANKPRVVAPAA